MGFVVLDEPLQQNPDPEHRRLFVEFLQSAAARQLRYQTIVFTSLHDDEGLRLKQAGARLEMPAGEHLLRPSHETGDKGHQEHADNHTTMRSEIM
jgi:hypothetical protein